MLHTVAHVCVYVCVFVRQRTIDQGKHFDFVQSNVDVFLFFNPKKKEKQGNIFPSLVYCAAILHAIFKTTSKSTEQWRVKEADAHTAQQSPAYNVHHMER